MIRTLLVPGTALPVCASLVLLALAAPTPAQTPLLHAVAQPPAAARAWDATERATNPAILRSTFVRVDTAALRAARGAVTADLFGDVRTLDVGAPGDVLGYATWSGSERAQGGMVVLAVADDGVTAGVIVDGDRRFAVAHTGVADVHVLHELDPAHDPFGCDTDHRHAVTAPQADLPGGGGSALSSTTTTLDVLIAYTPRARTTGGGVTGVETTIVAGVLQANRTNQNSAVDAQFRLVHLVETPYVENSNDDLSRFRTIGDGYMDELHALQSLYGADLMHLVTQPPSLGYCGVAYLMQTVSSGFRGYAFGVTVRSCIGGNTMCHELGHNLGCSHDRANAGRSSYTFAYGYRTPDNAYRTVMSYSPGTRVDFWSSPSATHAGYTLGVNNREDNARTLGLTKGTASQFTATRTYLWETIPGAIYGRLGRPEIAGQGVAPNVAPIEVRIERYAPNAPGVVIFGAQELGLPALGGVLVPSPDVTVSVSGNGVTPITVPLPFLAGLPAGTELWMQAAFVDSIAQQGIAATDGLKFCGL